MGMVICFGSVLTPLWLLSERVLSFMTLSIWIRLVGRDCLLWHGWLPALSGADDGDPWAVDAADVASKRLEVALGSYVGVSQEPGGEFSLVEDDVPLADAPDVWPDGSLVLDGFSGVGVAGYGVYAHASGAAWFGRQRSAPGFASPIA